MGYIHICPLLCFTSSSDMKAVSGFSAVSLYEHILDFHKIQANLYQIHTQSIFVTLCMFH